MTTEADDRPNLANPTWEYLFHNHTKSVLQKRCRELGFTKIWVNKDKLVDMIMSKQPSQAQELESPDSPSGTLQQMKSEIRDMKLKMNTKDNEISELNELLKTAQVTINRLNDRLTTLEERVQRAEYHSLPTHTESSPNHSEVTPVKTLLLGDTNLIDAQAADLEENCFMRTIKDANIDLMTCWVSEKLNWSPDKCILYCGIHDILEGTSPNSVIDNLGTLIAELKQVNENMDICVCHLVPT